MVRTASWWTWWISGTLSLPKHMWHHLSRQKRLKLSVIFTEFSNKLPLNALTWSQLIPPKIKMASRKKIVLRSPCGTVGMGLKMIVYDFPLCCPKCLLVISSHHEKCRIFEVDIYLCWGTPNDLRTFEYWQSCFHKWGSHPYNLDFDARIKKKEVTILKEKYKTAKPALPGVLT